MVKAAFWKTDWFAGSVLALVMLAVSGTDLVQSLERKAYDLGVQYSDRTPSDKVAVIAIDDQSIANIGRWPWSRDVHARMVDFLAGGQAKVVGYTAFFYEPEFSKGYPYIVRLAELIAQASSEGVEPIPEIEKIATLLQEAERELNTDRKLADSFAKAKNIVLPMTFSIGEPRGRPDKALPAFVTRHALKRFGQTGGGALPGVAVQVPIESLGAHAVALGHLTIRPDVDGGIRSEPLVVDYYGEQYPAFSLMLAARSLNLAAADIRVAPGFEVRLGNLRIPTDADTRMNTFFYREAGAGQPFAVDSFYDVISGKIPASKYANKIVLIGATAEGVGANQVTPVSGNMSPVLVLAHTVSSILQEHFFVAPSWGIWLTFGVFLLVAIYLIALLPRLSAAIGAASTALLLILIIGLHFGLMVGSGQWVQLMTSASLLIIGHLLLTTKRFLVTERGKQKSDFESAESNRMLGLAFQGQGQLDMAFDKFRKCPMDEGLMENLYNLALDYERKRQFNKAEAVFRYMADYSLDFRDLPQKLARAKKLAETVLLGSGAGQAAGGTLILADGEVEKPMLGRYQLEKELGKGAMGVVYLGRDPKINRVVAIKTMALSQEFDGDELTEVKARFFREAETAGRLNHPNIVTIYDAGEEHDLAYIAMEFLKGRDLVPYTKADHLLPLPRVLSIIARVAEALDYAHRNNVVHRDIKPANIMYEAEADQVKVTDFGIARITDSSRTRTGMVLGTPSYMSPEQLAGKKIDGRSDLFSLGATCYQLCCGRLPFIGESMAQLMFNISSEPPQDILRIAPGLPPGLVAVVNKALTKDPAQRYQTGAEMAADLRTCLAESGGQGAEVDFQL